MKIPLHRCISTYQATGVQSKLHKYNPARNETNFTYCLANRLICDEDGAPIDRQRNVWYKLNISKNNLSLKQQPPNSTLATSIYRRLWRDTWRRRRHHRRIAASSVWNFDQSYDSLVRTVQTVGGSQPRLRDCTANAREWWAGCDTTSRRVVWQPDGVLSWRPSKRAWSLLITIYLFIYYKNRLAIIILTYMNRFL